MWGSSYDQRRTKVARQRKGWMKRRCFLLSLAAATFAGSGAQAKSMAPPPEPTHCTVHKTRLQAGKVRIMYGLVRPMPGAIEAEKQFPFARIAVLGGCVIPPGAPKERDVQFCTDCRKAAAAWEQKQREEHGPGEKRRSP
jgi:hypothetical protein